MKEKEPKRAGIEVQDEQLSQDWVEAGKQTHKKKVINYPEGLPKENNQKKT